MKTKRVKNKRDARAKYTLSDKQLKKIKAEVTAEAVTKTGMLYLVALAEKDGEKMISLISLRLSQDTPSTLTIRL